VKSLGIGKITRNWLIIGLIFFCVLCRYSREGFREAHAHTHAQNLANGSFAVSAGFTLANCPATVVSGLTATTFCPVASGQIYYCPSTVTTCATSTTGWILATAPPTNAGITGITKNGVSVPVTNGVAALTIGATSTSTATAPPATFASNGALTVSAPTVTTTTSIQ
jgi:hypothetical protein